MPVLRPIAVTQLPSYMTLFTGLFSISTFKHIILNRHWM